ncbi:MAG: SH3 domain-containing protein [Chloroflexi bacterium]|nr:SH3 domain-containing protein [Chloroflexota bacterium]
MKRAGAFISIGFLALAACQTPTPAAPAVTATARPIVAATVTVAPSTAPTSTSAPTATAEATLTPAAEATATATPTAESTQPAIPTSTSTPTTPAIPATRKVFVNADDVNFRDGPSTAANIILVLAQGAALTAIDQPTAPDAGGIAWQNVQTDGGRSGWVAAQLLSAATATPAPTPPPAPSGTPVVTPVADAGYVYVASVDGLNMRADHSASSSVVTQLANGQRLQTNGLGFGPDDQGLKWLNVKTEDGTLGWVAADYVSTEVPSVKPADPPANEQAIAAELLRRTNALRQQNGLPPYAVDPGLTTLALAHSEYMSQNGLTHNDAQGQTASKRLAGHGYGGRPTENIYYSGDFEDAWNYWSIDVPHLQNLLNPVNTVIGIGVMKVGFIYYLTQDFAIPPQ